MNEDEKSESHRRENLIFTNNTFVHNILGMWKIFSFTKQITC